jgi:hypothetical protein
LCKWFFFLVLFSVVAVAGEAFLARFPDGFEKSLERSQIEVLKHFKDRLGDGSQSAEFDLESFIIYRCVVGSRAYGLDNDESDTDRRGIYLAPAELQWSLFREPEQFEDNATQSCYWELQKFLTMALKANPNILECLYSPMVEKVTPGNGVNRRSPGLLEPDDFPDLQWLRHVSVQKDRAGHT